MILKINKLKKLIIIIMIGSCLFASEKDYNFYEIKECVIPIPKYLNLTRQDSKYEYNFFETRIINESIIFNKIVITNKKANDYNDIINAVKKSEKENWEQPIKVKKDYHYKGFTVLIRQMGSDDHILIYSLLGQKSTFFIAGDSIDIDTITYIMDYCNKTRKQR